MVSITKRALLVGIAVATTVGFAGMAQADGLPKVEKKATYKVGFSQTESNNPWRIAETESIKAEAAKRGWQLVYTDAAGSSAKQVADVNNLIAQGVDFIFLAPREEKPLVPAVMAAKKAGIPVFLLDRKVDEAAQPGRDYVAFIGSDFVSEGRRAGEWLVKETGGKAKLIELLGTVGATSTVDRHAGFAEALKDNPGIEVVAAQSGEYERDKGRQVTETLIQAHPDATAIYAHNDEMALGAVAALEAIGKKPGVDILIASVDGTKDAVTAIAAGKINITVECNPRLGPFAFDAAEKYANGEEVPHWVKVEDGFYDKNNAAASIDSAF